MSKFGYDKPVDHINIEIHHKKPNGNYKAKWDFHIILDDLGKVVKTIETGKWSKKQNNKIYKVEENKLCIN